LVDQNVKAFKVEAQDPFPLKFHEDTNFGSHHMISEVTISKNGRVDVITETNNHVAAKGNCGRVAVWLKDKKVNWLIPPQGHHRFCVDGTFVPIGQSVRKDHWDFTVSPDILKQVAGLGILQTRDSVNPLDRGRENLEKVDRLFQACPNCARAATAAQ
jgi:hypothetical protein